MRGSKQIQQLARQLFSLSMVDGALSAERVAGVLQYLEKHPPAQPIPVLQAYRRLVAAEVAKGQAVVEHAGPVADTLLKSIEGAMSQRYRRPVVAVARPRSELLAGLRVRVGDDVYESSVAGQLATLSV
jgi:F-type H+-transporting ATPase subunit delta